MPLPEQHAHQHTLGEHEFLGVRTNKHPPPLGNSISFPSTHHSSHQTQHSLHQENPFQSSQSNQDTSHETTTVFIKHNAATHFPSKTEHHFNQREQFLSNQHTSHEKHTQFQPRPQERGYGKTIEIYMRQIPKTHQVHTAAHPIAYACQ